MYGGIYDGIYDGISDGIYDGIYDGICFGRLNFILLYTMAFCDALIGTMISHRHGIWLSYSQEKQNNHI